MRTLRLARIAAEAEGLRLRERVKRTIVRLILGVIALIFLAAALAFAHVAGWYWLRNSFQPLQTALILLGIDLVIAVVFALLAARSAPSRAELDAMALRNRAWENAKADISIAAVTLQLARTVGGLVRRSRR